LNYKNGKDILPTRLLEELQKYIEGEIIYIPRKNQSRAAWGAMNGTRGLLDVRNKEIYSLYKGGKGIYELGEMYSLSEDSIRKIIVKENRQLSRANG
jgi:Mor family transcriptional regulator